MLRSEIDAGTDLGQQVGGLVSAGALVPDDLIIELVGPRALVASAGGGYVLDGYPRSIEQAEALLASQSPPDLVIAVEAPDSVLVSRILARAEIEGRADDTVRACPPSTQSTATSCNVVRLSSRTSRGGHRLVHGSMQVPDLATLAARESNRPSARRSPESGDDRSPVRR
jgi:adenylate kinase family enzyme